MDTLEMRGRKLYLVTRSPMYGEPVMAVSWYSFDHEVPHGQIEMWRPLIGQRLDRFGAGYGTYIGERDGRRYILPQGGQTKPEFTEHESIPRPRGKTVEWQYGRWMRYTQAKGWQPA